MNRSRLGFTFLAIVLSGASLTGCVTKICGFKEKEITQYYIPAPEGLSRPPVPCEQVAFLESAPTGRKYRVLGVVAPPVNKYRSYGEMINAARASASLHGADAVYLVSEKEVEFNSWGFQAGGGFAGGGGAKGKTVQVYLKAIVWEQ